MIPRFLFLFWLILFPRIDYKNLIGKEVFSDRAFRSIIHSINFDLCKHLKNTFENAGGIAAGRYGGMIMKQRIRNKQFTGIAVFLTLLLVCLAAGMTPAHAAAFGMTENRKLLCP